MTPQSVALPTSAIPVLKARVSKRLAPGQNGTKRLQAEYGEAPVCVRYRQDGRKRYTTVELVIEEQALPPRAGTRNGACGSCRVTWQSAWALKIASSHLPEMPNNGYVQ